MSDSNSSKTSTERTTADKAMPSVPPSSNQPVPAGRDEPEPAHYEPRQHIQPLDIAPRAEVLLDQREITIQSYQTTVPYDHDALSGDLENAWLTPQIRFGVFSRERLEGTETASVVLGLQDEISVRTYDYDQRRPLWFSWQDVIVDTVGIRYVSDENGLLCFRATGGGRRITDKMIHQFNSAHLHIPEATVTKRQFDLDKLREMCFGRFLGRLYMLRFSGPEAAEYRSIDHALFQSRQYIDPQAPRVLEVKADAEAKIESFDSDIEITCTDLAAPIRVRFFIRGTSGSLRLRFPKISYRRELRTTQEQARVAYRILDLTVNAILDDDYYAHQQPSLGDLSGTPQIMLPGLEDLTPYREALSAPTPREEFIADLNVDDPHKQNWQPHLRALDELLEADGVQAHIAELLAGLAVAHPQRVVALLLACGADALMRHVGTVAARAAAGELQAVPAERRAQMEEGLLSWALVHEEDSWDVTPETGEIRTLGTLRWLAEDLSPDMLHRVVWKLLGVMHARLSSASGDIAPLLGRYHWCTEVAKAVSPQQSGLQRALRLLAEDHVPRTPDESAKLFKEPVSDLRSLDRAVLDSYGLPLWPAFHACRKDGQVVLSNVGVGSALALTIIPDGMLFVDSGSAESTDFLAGASMQLPVPDGHAAVALQFEKLGGQHVVSVPIAETTAEAGDAEGRSDAERLGEMHADIRELKDTAAILPGAIAKIDEGVETVKDHVRGVPRLQADLAQAREFPEAAALELHNRITAILTVEQQEIWRAVRSAGGIQKDALPELKRKGIVGSTATLSRRVKEIDATLRENDLPPCNASGPPVQFTRTGGYESINGTMVPQQLSAVEADWAKDEVERETTIKAYLAASPEDRAFFHETKPGIREEAERYQTGEK